MKLYTQLVAPNPTKVEIYLAEKAALGCTIEIDREMVDLSKGHHRSPELSKKNPMQRVPFLELNDGNVIGESLPIIEYFEERHPIPSLIGDSPEARALVRGMERTLDTGIMREVVEIAHATKSPTGRAPNAGVVAWFHDSVATPLRYVDGLLADNRPFVMGERVTIADGTLAASLQFARFTKLDVFDAYTNIQSWDERYRARSHLKDVIVL